MDKHTCKIITLKNQEWFKKALEEKKYQVHENDLTIFCQHISNVQAYDGKNHYEVANSHGRGTVAEKEQEAEIYDIATKISGASTEKMLKIGYLNIIKEKIRNDLEVYSKLLDAMGISGEEGKITLKDVAERLGGK